MSPITHLASIALPLVVRTALKIISIIYYGGATASMAPTTLRLRARFDGRHGFDGGWRQSGRTSSRPLSAELGRWNGSAGADRTERRFVTTHSPKRISRCRPILSKNSGSGRSSAVKGAAWRRSDYRIAQNTLQKWSGTSRERQTFSRSRTSMTLEALPRSFQRNWPVPLTRSQSDGEQADLLTACDDQPLRIWKSPYRRQMSGRSFRTIRSDNLLARSASGFRCLRICLPTRSSISRRRDLAAGS